MKPSSQDFESALETLLNATRIEARAIAAGELGDYGDSRAIEPLRACLDSNASELVASAIRALGQLKDEFSIPRFLAFLDKSNNQLARVEAIGALCRLNYQPAQAYFKEMLLDYDYLIRQHAISGLLTPSNIEGQEIKDALQAMLSDPWEGNRMLAQTFLEYIRDKEEKEGKKH